MTTQIEKTRGRIKLILWLFVVGLVLSGVTAFPIRAEMDILVRYCGVGSSIGERFPALGVWISRVHRGVTEQGREHPFLSYGTDWLAFAHIVIAIAFIGPLRDPVKNIWVIEFGIIACVLVVPLALICGPIRGIPFFWRLIDCSFGVAGIIPLWLTRRMVHKLEELEAAPNQTLQQNRTANGTAEREHSAT